MTFPRTILVVEDGTEYTDAFEKLADWDSIELVRAGDRGEAARLLEERPIDAIFLDVVFDRTPSNRLAGDLAEQVRRFGGDRARAARHLAENQGFYLLDVLAPLVESALPVVIAYDFSAEPERLAALREKHANLS
ncbi:MAG TPA: hypothetical protein VFW15_00680 [Thermoanaerobaculia bacterium]|nr:hypothetical protein [Thermoanaerobaculia bacterium]